MGLDMYLYAKKYTSKYNDEELNKKLWALFPQLKPIDNIDMAEVKLEIGYWRKANAIHKWFVENVQDGEDDCGHYHVEREQLEKLREEIKKVLTDKNRVIMRLSQGKVNPVIEDNALPTQDGFFFGGTDYDEYYWRDLENTLNLLNDILDNPEKYEGFEFEYHSSW